MPVTAIPDNNIFDKISASGRLFEADNTTGALRLKTEVVIVGSGAGGSVVAAELARAGIDVVIVESGRFWRPHVDFTQREETMNPALLYHGGARVTKDKALMITHGKGVGGSTVHNICLSVEPPPAIIARWQDEFGYPFSREDMQPFVNRVRMQLGINPIFAAQMNANNRALKRGADAHKWKGFVPEHNRVACLECGFCELGCAFNRKQSALITYIPQAMHNGARLVADTKIVRVLHDGKRVQGVVGVMQAPGQKQSVPVQIMARTVVASGGAILSPALLRASGVPDPYEQIGSSFRTHPAVPVGGFGDEKIVGWKGIPQTYMVNEFATYEKTGYGGFTLFPIFGHPGQTAALVPGLGSAYTQRLSRYDHMVAVAPMIHDETMGQVTADSKGNPVVDYFPDAADQRELVKGVQRSVELLLAAGLKEVFVPYIDQPLLVKNKKQLAEIARRGIVRNKVALNAVHPQGSIRFAADPKDGAVTFAGRYRYLKNLYIADASLFPTSIGTAPTISVMTVASMVAAAMLDRRKEITG